jgi:hypothetical protein
MTLLKFWSLLSNSEKFFFPVSNFRAYISLYEMPLFHAAYSSVLKITATDSYKHDRYLLNYMALHLQGQ